MEMAKPVCESLRLLSPLFRLEEFVMNKWTLKVEREFDSAHCLESHKGKCKNKHGHRWKVLVVISAHSLDNESNMVADFHDVKEIIDKLDHIDLNDFLGVANPTSEYIAQWLYKNIQRKLQSPPKVEKVIVWESEGCSCEYSESE